jgi:hypothetical protein
VKTNRRWRDGSNPAQWPLSTGRLGRSVAAILDAQDSMPRAGLKQCVASGSGTGRPETEQIQILLTSSEVLSDMNKS